MRAIISMRARNHDSNIFPIYIFLSFNFYLFPQLLGKTKFLAALKSELWNLNGRLRHQKPLGFHFFTSKAWWESVGFSLFSVWGIIWWLRKIVCMQLHLFSFIDLNSEHNLGLVSPCLQMFVELWLSSSWLQITIVYYGKTTIGLY